MVIRTTSSVMEDVWKDSCVSCAFANTVPSKLFVVAAIPICQIDEVTDWNSDSRVQPYGPNAVQMTFLVTNCGALPYINLDHQIPK